MGTGRAGQLGTEVVTAVASHRVEQVKPAAQKNGSETLAAEAWAGGFKPRAAKV